MKVKISRNWYIDNNLKWVIDNAEFMFTIKGDGRPIIYTKEKKGPYNCFKIDNDKYGITLNSMSEYSDAVFENGVSEMTRDNFIDYFKKWMTNYGAGEFINPKSGFFDFLKSKKDIIIEI